MRWLLCFALMLCGVSSFAQTKSGTLELKLVVVDDLQPKPVPYHDVTITSESGFKIGARTNLEGRLMMELRTGKYEVSSDVPAEYKGKHYKWKKAFDIAPGIKKELVLTQADAIATETNPATPVVEEKPPVVKKETTEPPAKPTTSENRTVALLPWSLAAGTDTARDTVRKSILSVFEKLNYEVTPEARTKRLWEEDMGKHVIQLTPEDEDTLQPLPTPKELLELGRKMGVSLVCAGRAKWHTKSIWVGLGPKTKADCTVDVILVDVEKGEVVLNAENVTVDSTKKESGLETLGALFIAWGITMFSGGPKTPHQQRAGALAVATAFEPWAKTVAHSKRKIDGGD